MKTYLDDKKFRRLLKIHCVEENIQSFYLKSMIANIFSFIRNPKVYLEGDLGDEVFNAIYETLKDLNIKISPYDVVEMKSVTKEVKNEFGCIDTKYIGMTVEFKNIT